MSQEVVSDQKVAHAEISSLGLAILKRTVGLKVPRFLMLLFILLDQFFVQNVHRECSVFSLLSNGGKRLRILDAGCGLGYMSFKLVRSGHNVISGDINDGFRRTLHSVPLQYRNRMNFVRFDLSHLPFRENCFDVIICVDVLEHIEQPEIVLSDFYFDLASKGRLILHVPSIDGLGDDWSGKLVRGDSREAFRMHARNGYRTVELHRILKSCGFFRTEFFHTFSKTMQLMSRFEHTIPSRIMFHLLFRYIAKFQNPLRSDFSYSRNDFEGILTRATKEE